jgi:signal transduction histidine kinase
VQKQRTAGIAEMRSTRRSAILRGRSPFPIAVGLWCVDLPDVTGKTRVDQEDFVASISHEIKTPITVIQDLPGAPGRRWKMRYVLRSQDHQEQRRINSLVDDLMTISKLERA